MNGFIKRGLLTVLVTGGFLALGAGVAYADDNTDGSNGTASGSQAVLGATLPITIGGNGISVIGDSSSTGSSNTGGSGGSSPSASTGGTNSLLGGTHGVADADVPVTVGGNAISVLGDSSSDGSPFAGESGSGDAGSTSTSGKDGILGGSEVVADPSAPVTVGGNAVSVVGDSSTTGSDSSTPATGGSPAAFTTGDDAVLGGTQLVTGADAPVTLGGNAVSVIGDSTVDNGDNGDDGQDGDVGGETITPPETDPGTVTTAAVGAITLLAATGSDLLVPGLAFAVLMLAAGIAVMTRTRTARR